MDLSMVGFDESTCFPPSDPETKHKIYGSDWRGLKMAKTEDYSSAWGNKQMLRSNSNLSDGQMLSFSLGDSKNGGFDLYNNASSGYCTNTGYGSGGGINGIIAGVRGSFTASQWMELEHQALIYKYLLANIPVPSNLLFPIKKALESAGLSAFSIGSLRPPTYGWNGFHFGFSRNTDPEPGRCRRTDGKKWRCSRDAVPDQKYCERHINRGRHRSRKPVEGHNGPTTTPVTNTAATSAKAALAVVTGGSGANGLSMSHQSQPSASSLNMNGIFLNKNNAVDRNQAATDLSIFSSGITSKTNKFSIEKHPSQSEFGLVSFDSLINPIQETPSNTLNNRNNSFQQTSVHHQFIDEWPKNELSISIPTSTDFMSSTSSPTEEKAASPLRLFSKQASWVPISWEGPLGEALHNTSNQMSLSEMTNLATSPNGPFQRMAFGSQSNSSAGSSPRGANASFAPLL